MRSSLPQLPAVMLPSKNDISSVLAKLESKDPYAGEPMFGKVSIFVGGYLWQSFACAALSFSISKELEPISRFDMIHFSVSASSDGVKQSSTSTLNEKRRCVAFE